MAKCKNCDEKFYYIEILRSLLKNGKISCHKCHSNNEIEIISKFTFYGLLILFIPMILNPILRNLELSRYLSLTLYLSYISIVILLSPFLIKYE